MIFLNCDKVSSIFYFFNTVIKRIGDGRIARKAVKTQGVQGSVFRVLLGPGV